MVLFLNVTPLRWRALYTPFYVSNDIYAQPLGWFVYGSLRIVILYILAQSSNISSNYYFVVL